MTLPTSMPLGNQNNNVLDQMDLKSLKSNERGTCLLIELKRHMDRYEIDSILKLRVEWSVALIGVGTR